MIGRSIGTLLVFKKLNIPTGPFHLLADLHPWSH